MLARILTPALLCGLVLSASACTRQADPSETTSRDAAAPASTVLLTVEGMSCTFNCKPAVEAALASVEGVSSVEVDFEAKTAKVECEKPIDPTVLVKALPERFTATVKN
ncbi:MAG TPA: cation transporter [Planctomycetota bacterium]|nr:cation transporter [Planctomycetota bacterium]